MMIGEKALLLFNNRQLGYKKKKAFRYSWKSGEIFTYYHDWVISQMDEVIYDCNSGGIPHKHCIDIMISNKPVRESLK